MTLAHSDSVVRRSAGLAEIYQDLHRHPELAFAEHRTAGLLAAEIAAAGFTVQTGIGGTGVVGLLRRGAGPVIMMRAELDALPLAEQTDAPYAADPRSATPVMHACGHDLHLAWLIGAARHLATRADWTGTIIALGQPAEETGEGAAAMIADGLLDRVPAPDVLLAQHVGPAPVGTFGTTAGPLLAGSATVDVCFTAPQVRDRLADPSDPARLAAGFVANLPDGSRRAVARPEATIAVLAVNAGDPARKQVATPDRATVRLVVRCPTEAAHDQARVMITQLATSEAAAHQAPAPVLDWHGTIAPVINDPALAERVITAVRAELGERAAGTIPPGPSSDDFSRLTAAAGCPAVYGYVGGGDPAAWRHAMSTGDRSKIITNHSARFLPAPAAVGIGVRVWCRTVIDLLSGDRTRTRFS